MRDKTNARFLPIVIAPAVMPAILLPIMVSNHVPGDVLGATFGFFIGLAILALVWIAKRRSSCEPPVV